ncbi:MAG: hypothetical protein WB445_13995 [Acinetobacter sp.]|uniref:hypothetical protein n=1 Tax=Acinetobacter sp. TaxID=472 RepID=UPI002FCB1B4A
MNISVKEINKKLEDFKEAGNNPSLIVIGYMTYSKLMKDAKFSDQVTKDVNDLLVRYYQGVEIRMVTKKHYFEIQ